MIRQYSVKMDDTQATSLVGAMGFLLNSNIREWLSAWVGSGNWSYGPQPNWSATSGEDHFFYFDKESDALLFKLVWG